jgi:hypothetical protein
MERVGAFLLTAVMLIAKRPGFITLTIIVTVIITGAYAVSFFLDIRAMFCSRV